MAKLEGGWPERVLTMQRNWIGRSEGAEIDFHLARLRRADPRLHHARRHHLRRHLRDPRARASADRDAARRRAARRAPRPWWTRAQGRDPGDIEKEGFFTGHYAVNPYSGEQVPIWVANFVLMGYGTGAIMAVPGARRARLRILPQVRHRHPPGDPPRGWRARRRAGHDRRPSPSTASSRIPASGPACRARRRAAQMAAYAESTASARPPSPTASRTGASRASATGARRSR